MDPILILLTAIVVVVGGVLFLRLHAVIALLGGAFLVALLTPSDSVYRHEIRRAGLTVESVGTVGEVRLRLGKGRQVVPGRQAVFRHRVDTGETELVGHATLSVLPGRLGPDVVRLVPEGELPAIEVGDLVLHHTAVAAARETAGETIGQRVAEGFGGTCAKIGILIALAAIIGKCLLESGAAERIVSAVHGLCGDRQAPLAFVVSGFVVGIPVFFDTVFYLLIPLGKALAARTRKHYLLYVLSIIVGATMAHSLVPPTPGPLFVASELGVSVGLMMLGGIVVGGLAAAAGYGFAVFADRRWEIPLRDLGEPPAGGTPSGTATARGPLPSFWLALLPIVLPVILLGTKTVVDLQLAGTGWEDQPDWLAAWWPVLRTLGDKNVALGLATVVALLMLARAYEWRGNQCGAALQSAVLSGGGIVLITASGGALGHVLRQSGIAQAIQQQLPGTETGLALLGVAFGITAVIRIAQGSATVAMITAVGIVGPLAAAAPLPYHPLYLALAIGCGSKPLPWMNDSGFWVVGQMSGMTGMETLKTFSLALSVMGVAGFLATLVGAWLLPLA